MILVIKKNVLFVAMWLWSRALCSNPSASILSARCPSLSPSSLYRPRVLLSVWRQFKIWEKRSVGVPGHHTEPSGARNMRSGVYKATGRGSRPSEIIRCLCLPGFWQVERLCLRIRPNESHYEPLSRLSDTQTHIASAAADISAKWIELFARFLNVRKYQSISTVFCQFGHLAWLCLSFSLPLLSLFLFKCVLFIPYLHTEHQCIYIAHMI